MKFGLWRSFASSNGGGCFDHTYSWFGPDLPLLNTKCSCSIDRTFCLRGNGGFVNLGSASLCGWSRPLKFRTYGPGVQVVCIPAFSHVALSRVEYITVSFSYRLPCDHGVYGHNQLQGVECRSKMSLVAALRLIVDSFVPRDVPATTVYCCLLRCVGDTGSATAALSSDVFEL